MISEKARNILVNTMGVTAIVIAGFILFWLGTVGMMMGWMVHDFNKSEGGFLVMLLSGIFGCLTLVTGIGILRRRPWSRIALMVIWIIIAAIVILTILLSMGSISEGIGACVSWLIIVILGILQVIFIGNSRVKELFIH
jgi:hypothetical protein